MTQEFVTLPREVVEQALDALQDADTIIEHHQDVGLRRSSMASLRSALDQPQSKQEPVSWIENFEGSVSYGPIHESARKLPEGVRFDLYTRPQPSLQPLTVEQIDGIIRDLDPSWLDTPTGFEEEFCRAIEAAHNIK